MAFLKNVSFGDLKLCVWMRDRNIEENILLQKYQHMCRQGFIIALSYIILD